MRQLLQQKCTDMTYPSQYDTKLEVNHLQKLQHYVSYLWLRASNDFGASHYGIQTIKMGFNHFWMLVTFQYRGLHHLGMYCTLIIEAWLKSNIHFNCRYLELWHACIISLVFIVLNVREGTESKYPSIVFLSIHFQRAKSADWLWCTLFSIPPLNLWLLDCLEIRSDVYPYSTFLAHMLFRRTLGIILIWVAYTIWTSAFQLIL